MGQALPGLASVGKALGWEGQEAVSTHLALQVCSWTCSRPTSWEFARNAHPLKRIASEIWGAAPLLQQVHPRALLLHSVCRVLL